ncbi:MerR family transcriptional regulator [Olsenella uli]|uniref:MerR family transcriptional regulator n=2 Tax=Olsenella uli TaxID=133926 RepID=UPI0024A9492A|nr:MerR family transcriptional regulator [Olsenella uli]
MRFEEVRMDESSKLIKISEMASMHGVSRQTLILYDKNGLLKPAFVSETGYRYYSTDQIPYLRLICLLKKMGVSLSDIGRYMGRRSAEGMLALLDERRAKVDAEITRLELQREELRQFMELFSDVGTKSRNLDRPFVEHLGKRRAVFSAFPSTQMDVKKLHLALMGAWGSLLDAGMLPSRGFGAYYMVGGIRGPEPLRAAGSIVLLPHDGEVPGAEVITIPEGDYVTMYKRAMPYDLGPTYRLLDWMGENGFEPMGEVVDRCLLDSAFYDEEHNEDFCRLEIRVK